MLARRAVLGSTLLGALALAGCGIRLEDGVNLPLVPPRSPLPGEQAMLDLLQNSRDLATVLSTSKAPYAAALAPVLTSQAASLAQVLARADIPTESLLPSASASAGASGTTSGPASATASPSTSGAAAPTQSTPGADALATVALSWLPDLGAVTGSARSAVIAVLANRWAMIRTIGGVDPALPTTSPGSWPTDVVTALVAATREAIYGFEVVTAQSGPAPAKNASGTGRGPVTPQRAKASADLQSLQLIESQLAALDPTLAPAPMGYDLPFAVTDPASAKRLAASVGQGLREAYGAQLATVPAGSPALSAMVPWLGRAEWMAHEWGNAWSAFPGMRLP